MAGIGSSLRRGEPAAPPPGAGGPMPAAGGGAPMPGGQAAGGLDLGGQEPASPKEQEIYNRFVAKAYEMVYAEETLPKIIEMLRGEEGDDPADGLAITAATVTARVLDAAEAAGQQIDGAIVLHAGAEIFGDLAELSKRAGIHDWQEGTDEFEGAWYRALDDFRVMRQQAGRLDTEVYQQDLEGLKQADAEGELGAQLAALQGRGEAEPPGAPRGGIGGAMAKGRASAAAPAPEDDEEDEED